VGAVRLAIQLARRIAMHPKTEGVLESSLYVADVVSSAQFHRRVFGISGHQRFRKGGSRTVQSPQDGDGELHLAFAIPAAELVSWEDWLAENGIAVEEKRTWELGGQSLYFRDPDRHLIEVATPAVWSIY